MIWTTVVWLDVVPRNSTAELPLTNKRLVPLVAQNSIHLAPVPSLVAARKVTLTGALTAVGGGQKRAADAAATRAARRMIHFFFMRALMPNDRAQAGRAESVRLSTETESRPGPEHVCWALVRLIPFMIGSSNSEANLKIVAAQAADSGA